MNRFENITINKFRGLGNIVFEKLKSINILIGDNNTGKTTILEAIQLFHNSDVVYNLVLIAKKREQKFGVISTYDSIISMFDYGVKNNKNISLSAQDETGGKYSINTNITIEKRVGDVLYPSDILYPSDNLYPSDDVEKELLHIDYNVNKNSLSISNGLENIYRQRNGIKADENKKDMFKIEYISPIAHYSQEFAQAALSKSIKARKKNDIIDALKVFDDNIMGFDTIKEGGSYITHIDYKGLGVVPITIFGDGLKKVFTLSVGLVSIQNGILLIDEIETAIHKKAMERYFKWFVEAVKKNNVQVFLTTHSLEAIEAIINGSKDNIDDIASYRLERYKDKIISRRADGDMLNRIINNQGLDVR